MNIVAIDPGNVQSAIVIYDGGMPCQYGKTNNENILARLRTYSGHRQCGSAGGLVPSHLAIEVMKPRGMAVSQESFQTCLWAGRFIQAWGGEDFTQIDRKDVKMCLCNSAKAKDSNIRQAIIDRYGGKEAAIGKKANPGPLYGMANDVWQAMGVAITWWENDRLRKDGA